MSSTQQRIPAQRIARPAVAAIAAGRYQRGPCRGYQIPVPGGVGSTKRAGLAVLAARH